MQKRLLLFFGLFLVQNGYGLDCALACFGKKARRQQNQLQVARPEQAPIQNSDCAAGVLKRPEDCMEIVAQETWFPKDVSQLVAGYVGYRVKKTLPAQESICVEHVMPDGRLVCVTRDGQITVRNLMTNEILQSLHIPRQEMEEWCIKRPIASFDNDYIAVDFDAVRAPKTRSIDIFDIRAGRRLMYYTSKFPLSADGDSIILPLVDNQFLFAYKRCHPATVLTIGHPERDRGSWI